MTDETAITAKEIEVVEKIEEANEEAVANVQKDINTNVNISIANEDIRYHIFYLNLVNYRIYTCIVESKR